MKRIFSFKNFWFNVQDFFNPIKLTLSKLNDIKSCGLKYKFRNHYNLDEIVSQEYPQGTIGMLIHQYIYRILNNEIAFNIDTITDLIMTEVVEKHNNLTDEDKSFHKQNVVTMLECFSNWYEQNKDKVYLVNYNVEVKVEKMTLVTKCDCILKKEQEVGSSGKEAKKIEEYEIIDFVTSKKNISEEMLTYDFSTNFQYFVLQKYFESEKQKKKFRFKKMFLLFNNNAEFYLNKFQQKEVEKTIIETKNVLRKKDFKMRKGPLCGWCGYYDICPGWKIEREGDTKKNISPVAPTTTLFRIARETPGMMGLSYSKMSMFVQCPRKYKLCYLDRTGVKPQGFFSIGSSIHNTFEAFYQIDLRKGQTEPPIEKLYELYDKNWISAGYKSEEEEKEYYKNGKEWITNYYNKFVKGKYIKAYSVEEYFELPIGQGKHVMIGFYDRIQKNSDGSYEIFDYKTDPKVRTQEEVDKDLQLTIYYWSLRNRGIEAKKLSLIFVRFSEMVSTTRTQKDIEYIDNYVREVADNMVLKSEQLEQIRAEYKSNGEIVPQEKVDELFPAMVNKYCGGCDYLIGCPKENVIKTEYKDKLLFSVSETGEAIDKEIQEEVIAENSVEVQRKRNNQPRIAPI